MPEPEPASARSDGRPGADAGSAPLVIVADGGRDRMAQRLADAWKVPLRSVESAPVDAAARAVALVLRDGRAPELQGPDPGDGAVSIDVTGLARARRGRDPLLQAVGAKGTDRPHVVDATAGLGADAFALAASGCRVTAIERQPVLVFLLRDALERARTRPECAAAASRVEVVHGDARSWLHEHPGAAPVVFLDPMYPLQDLGAGRLRRVGKEMRLFRHLVGDDPDSGELLAAARRAATQRVVVKRPRRAEPLGGVAPSGSLEGRTTRFDLYPAARADSR